MPRHLSSRTKRCITALLTALVVIGASTEGGLTQNLRNAKQSLEKRKTRISSRYDTIGTRETLVGVRLPPPWDTTPPTPGTAEFMEAQNKAWELLINALFPQGFPGNQMRGAIPSQNSVEPFQSVPHMFRLHGLRSEGIPSLRKHPNILFVSTDPGVVSIEARQAQQNPITNPKQINLDNPGGIPFTDISGVTKLSKKDVDIDTIGAWPWSIGRPEVVIAIIDDNFNLTVPELKESVFVNTKEIPCNRIDDDRNGYIDDVSGYHIGYKTGCLQHTQKNTEHGTSMAIAISAPFRRPSDDSVVGIAPGARFLPISLGGDFTKLNEAYEYLLRMQSSGVPIRIVNLSLGFQLDPALADMAKCSLAARSKGLTPLGRLLASGILVVTAAGNDGSNNDTSPICPGNFAAVHDNVITVAAVDHAGKHPFFSNFGRTSVTTSAPGSAIYTGYGEYSTGTSIAAAQVSGIAALLYSIDPSLTAKRIKEVILASTKHKEELKLPTQSGGIVDAITAVRIVSGRIQPAGKKKPAL